MVLVGACECSETLLVDVARDSLLFKGIDEALWAQVAPTLRMRTFQDGEVICHEGGPADSLLIIWQGEVDVSRNRIHLITRRRLEVVGEQALINGGFRGATLTAKGLVQVVAVPAESFRELVRGAPFTLNLLRAVSEKLSEATDQRAFRYAVEKLLFTEFKAHVARPVLDELLVRGEDYGVPRVIEGVVLMSDIREFSTRSARLGPEQLARELGYYLEHAVDVVHRHGGMVDKFIGDAVMAVWGWPHETGADSVSNAFLCACELTVTAADFSLDGAPIAIGVGLNAGSMFIGNVGSGDKRQFTVLGNVVNMAARYESATKDLGAPIVMGHEFFDRLIAAYRSSAEIRPNHPVRGVEPQDLYVLPADAAGSIVGRK